MFLFKQQDFFRSNLNDHPQQLTRESDKFAISRDKEKEMDDSLLMGNGSGLWHLSTQKEPRLSPLDRYITNN